MADNYGELDNLLKPIKEDLHAVYLALGDIKTVEESEKFKKSLDTKSEKELAEMLDLGFIRTEFGSLANELSGLVGSFDSDLGAMLNTVSKIPDAISDVLNALKKAQQGGINSRGINTSSSGTSGSEGQESAENLINTVSQLSSVTDDASDGLSATSTSLNAVGTSGASAGAGATSASTGLLASVGAFAAVAVAVVAAVAAVVELTKAAYELGKVGFDTEYALQETRQILGTFFDSLYEKAKKFEEDYYLSVDRSMGAFADIAETARQAGYSQEQAIKLADELVTTAAEFSGNGIGNFEDNVASYKAFIEGDLDAVRGVSADDHAIAWMYAQETGRGRGGSTSDLDEKNQVKARELYLTTMLNMQKEKEINNTMSLSAMQTKLQNAWDLIGKKLKASFLPLVNMLTPLLLGFADGLYKVVNTIYDVLGIEKIDIGLDDVINEEGVNNSQALYKSAKEAGTAMDKFSNSLYGFDEVNVQDVFENSEIDDVAYDDSGIIDALDVIGANTKKTAENTKGGFADTISKFVSEATKIASDVLGFNEKPWDEQSAEEQMRTDPVKDLAEAFIKGEKLTPKQLFGDLFFTAVGNIPLIKAIREFKEGDWLGGLFQIIGGITGLAGPLNLVEDIINFIGKLVSGDENWEFDLSQIVQDKLEEWGKAISDWFNNFDIIAFFSDWGTTIGDWFDDTATAIRTWASETYNEFIAWKDEALQPIRDWIASVKETIGGIIDWFGEKADWVEDKISSLFSGNLFGDDDDDKGTSWFGFGSGKSYANGGIALRPHMAMIGDAPGGEIAFPLDSSSAIPFYDRVGANISERITTTNNNSGSFVSQDTININAGVIAGQTDYQLQRFAERIAKLIEQNKRSTGSYSLGTR